MSNLARELEETRKAYNGRESYIRITEAELKCIHRNCTYIAIYGQITKTNNPESLLNHALFMYFYSS